MSHSTGFSLAAWTSEQLPDAARLYPMTIADDEELAAMRRRFANNPGKLAGVEEYTRILAAADEAARSNAGAAILERFAARIREVRLALDR